MAPKLIYSTERYKLPFVKYTLPEYITYGKVTLKFGEVIDYKFQRACVAEFIAMLFFVTMCW